MPVDRVIAAVVAALVLFVATWAVLLLAWTTLVAWLPERSRQCPWLGASPRRRRWLAFAVSLVFAVAAGAYIGSRVELDIIDKLG